MKTAACYVRVSTAEQKNHGLSVDNQIQALTQYCKENDYRPVIYNDAGFSARKKYTSRPALLKMIEDCNAGKISIILFTKLDRFFRSVPDYYAVMSQIPNDVPWRAIWEDYETETSSGVFRVNIMLSVAQAEADRTSDRIRAVMDYRREKGDYLGNAPIGYVRDGKHIVFDPKTHDAMRAFWDAYMDTFSAIKAMEAAGEYGVRISRDHASRILQSETYSGVSGTETHPGYITPDQFAAVQSHRNQYIRDTHKKYDYILSGVLYCGKCGGRLSAHRIKRTKQDGTVVYYVCYSCRRHSDQRNAEKFVCPGVSISERKAERLLLASLESSLEQYNTSLTAEQQAMKNNDKKIQQLKTKLSKLKDIYILGDMTIDEYKERRDALTEEISALESEEEHPRAPIVVPENWKSIYESLDSAHRRSFWIQTTKRVVVHSKNEIYLEFT